MGSDGKIICLQCGRPGCIPCVREDPLEKEIATHSCTFAWTIPWTEEPGGLQSMGSQRVARLSSFTFEAHDFVLCKVTEMLTFLENLTAIPFLVLYFQIPFCCYSLCSF